MIMGDTSYFFFTLSKKYNKANKYLCELVVYVVIYVNMDLIVREISAGFGFDFAIVLSAAEFKRPRLLALYKITGSNLSPSLPKRVATYLSIASFLGSFHCLLNTITDLPVASASILIESRKSNIKKLELPVVVFCGK
jgi:low temperature requirement protein LtrA